MWSCQRWTIVSASSPGPATPRSIGRSGGSAIHTSVSRGVSSAPAGAGAEQVEPSGDGPVVDAADTSPDELRPYDLDDDDRRPTTLDDLADLLADPHEGVEPLTLDLRREDFEPDPRKLLRRALASRSPPTCVCILAAAGLRSVFR